MMHHDPACGEVHSKEGSIVLSTSSHNTMQSVVSSTDKKDDLELSSSSSSSWMELPLHLANQCRFPVGCPVTYEGKEGRTTKAWALLAQDSSGVWNGRFQCFHDIEFIVPKQENHDTDDANVMRKKEKVSVEELQFSIACPVHVLSAAVYRTQGPEWLEGTIVSTVISSQQDSLVSVDYCVRVHKIGRFNGIPLESLRYRPPPIVLSKDSTSVSFSTPKQEEAVATPLIPTPLQTPNETAVSPPSGKASLDSEFQAETEPRGMGNGIVSHNGTPKESALSGTSSSRPVVHAAPRDENANVTRASMDAVETLARKDIKFSSHILIPNSLELGPIQGIIGQKVKAALQQTFDCEIEMSIGHVRRDETTATPCFMNQTVFVLGRSKNQVLGAVGMLVDLLLKESMDDCADDKTHPEILYTDPIPIPPLQNGREKVVPGSVEYVVKRQVSKKKAASSNTDASLPLKKRMAKVVAKELQLAKESNTCTTRDVSSPPAINWTSSSSSSSSSSLSPCSSPKSTRPVSRPSSLAGDVLLEWGNIPKKQNTAPLGNSSGTRFHNNITKDTSPFSSHKSMRPVSTASSSLAVDGILKWGSIPKKQATAPSGNSPATHLQNSKRPNILRIPRKRVNVQFGNEVMSPPKKVRNETLEVPAKQQIHTTNLVLPDWVTKKHVHNELVGDCGEKMLDLRRKFESCSIIISEGNGLKGSKFVTITVSHVDASVVQNAMDHIKMILCQSLHHFKANRLFYELAYFQRNGRNIFHQVGDVLKETDKYTKKMRGDVFMTHVRLPPRVHPKCICGRGGAFQTNVKRTTNCDMIVAGDEQSQNLPFYIILIGGNETSVNKARDLVERRISTFT